MEFLKESCALPNGLAGLLPKRLQAVACGVEGEGQQVHGRERPGQVFLSMAEVVGQVIAVILQFNTLKLSFSIFQRARAQAAISTTFFAVTGRLVTKAPS